MNIKELDYKKNSLVKISKIVDSDKNVTLINILKLSKRINFYLSRASQSQKIILELNKKYNLNNVLLNESSNSAFFNKKKNPKIWIYVTEDEQFDTNSYLKYEKTLLEEITKQDVVIAIGQRAINFVNENNLEVMAYYKENDVELLSELLPEKIIDFLNINGYFDIAFIINSNKIKNSYINILPIDKFELYFNDHKEVEVLPEINNLTIFPDIHSFVEAELNSFLTYVSMMILNESALIREKYKLISQNKKLNDLDEKITLLNRKILREKREIEVEQISLLSKKKDLLHSIKKEQND